MPEKVLGSFADRLGSNIHEYLGQLAVLDIKQGNELAVEQDRAWFQVLVNGYPPVHFRVFLDFSGVEIHITQAGGTAKITVKLLVDGYGDLFQRPSWSSATREGI